VRAILKNYENVEVASQGKGRCTQTYKWTVHLNEKYGRGNTDTYEIEVEGFR